MHEMSEMVWVSTDNKIEILFPSSIHNLSPGWTIEIDAAMHIRHESNITAKLQNEEK